VELKRVGVIKKDEEPGKLRKDKISKLRPVFPDKNKEGTITGANASKINDGACSLLVAN
jgi:acetyl-CoA C-acetyltransferase